MLLVCSGLPLAQSPLSTLDRTLVDLLLPLEVSGQLQLGQVLRQTLEGAPRIAVNRGDKVQEYFALNFEQPVFDDLFGAPLFLATAVSGQDWQNQNKAHVRLLDKPLSATALNTKAYRYESGTPRDFLSMFSVIADQSVRLRIEDPYLASGARNRAALADFLAKLQEMNVKIELVMLVWRPARPGIQSHYDEERPEDQQSDLLLRLNKIGLRSEIVQLRPQTGRQRHFHDRVINASIATPESSGSFRWDISSGIDNLMERERQCSVFLTTKDVTNFS